jgi:hypothetical protein
MAAHSTRAIEELAGLPEAVRDALGLIADKGQPFNGSDVLVFGQPSRRFVSATQTGTLYFVWYLQGGFFLSTRVVVYRLEAGAAEATVVRRELASRACELVDELLDGKSPN